MQIFAKKIAKFAHLAGDGKDKYIKALEIGFNDIDVMVKDKYIKALEIGFNDIDVMVYEERLDDSKKFTDDEFKQLLNGCHVKY